MICQTRQRPFLALPNTLRITWCPAYLRRVVPCIFRQDLRSSGWPFSEQYLDSQMTGSRVGVHLENDLLRKRGYPDFLWSMCYECILRLASQSKLWGVLVQILSPCQLLAADWVIAQALARINGKRDRNALCRIVHTNYICKYEFKSPVRLWRG